MYFCIFGGTYCNAVGITTDNIYITTDRYLNQIFHESEFLTMPIVAHQIQSI